MTASLRSYLVPGVMAAALAFGAARAQMPRHPSPPTPSPIPAAGVYEGESTSGDFQEALNEAVAQAGRSESGGVVRYQVTGITGEFGGPGSLHTLKVEISTGKRERLPMKVTER